MKDYSALFDKKKLPELILCVIFIIYLIGAFSIPSNVATVIDTNMGKILICIATIGLFAYTNPFLGVLGLFVAYKIIQGAGKITGSDALAEYYPTEQKKWTPFTPNQQFPYTLEQEVVKKMTTQKFNTNYVKTDWRPTLDATHDAEYLNKK